MATKQYIKDKNSGEKLEITDANRERVESAYRANPNDYELLSEEESDEPEEVEEVPEDSEGYSKAIGNLRSYYKGDFDELLDNVRSKRRPKDLNKNSKTDYLLRAIRHFDNNSTKSEGELYSSLPDENPYKEDLIASKGRETWYKDGAKDEEGISVGETLLPNLSYRDKQGAGGVSKAIAGAQDVLSLGTRTGSALLNSLGGSPMSKRLDFMEMIGRPNKYSTGVEEMFDFGASGMLSGPIVKGAARLGGKAIPVGNAVSQLLRKNKQIDKGLDFLNKAKLGTEDAADIVNSIYQKTGGAAAGNALNAAVDLSKKAKALELAKKAGKGAINGVVEAAPYELLPTAFDLTDPDKSLGDAALTAGLGFGLAGLGSGVGRAYDTDILKYADELTDGRASINRIKQAADIDKLTPQSSTAGVEQLSKIRGTLDDILNKAGSDRRSALDDVMSKSRATSTSPSYDLDNLPVDTDLGDISPIFKGYEDLPYDSRSVFEQEARDSYKRLSDKTPGAPPKKLIDEVSLIGKRYGSATADSPSKVAYNKLYHNLLNMEPDEIARMGLTDADAVDVIKRLDDARGVFSDTYDILDDVLPATKGGKAIPAKEESFLRKAAQSRLRPSTSSADAVTAIETSNAIADLLERTGLSKAPDVDLDFLTPATLRQVNERGRGGFATAADEIANKIPLSVSGLGRDAVIDLGQQVVKDVSTRGVGVPRLITGEESEDLETDEYGFYPSMDAANKSQFKKNKEK